jgi:hypothetical protein
MDRESSDKGEALSAKATIGGVSGFENPSILQVNHLDFHQAFAPDSRGNTLTGVDRASRIAPTYVFRRHSLPWPGPNRISSPDIPDLIYSIEVKTPIKHPFRTRLTKARACPDGNQTSPGERGETYPGPSLRWQWRFRRASVYCDGSHSHPQIEVFRTPRSRRKIQNLPAPQRKDCACRSLGKIRL